MGPRLTGVIGIRLAAYQSLCLAAKESCLGEEQAMKILSDMMANDPDIPETMKMWIRSGGFAGMTLAEFMEKMGTPETP